MKLLNTPILYEQSFEAIDHEKGIISGVHVCCEGEAKGHGVSLDKEFIRNVVSFGNEQSVGVKSRFGHPNMSTTTLGTFIGRFKNFKYKLIERSGGEKAGTAVADLHLDEVSKKSPNGNLFEYVLEMADTNPDMFGNSIVFRHGEDKEEKEKVGEDDKGKPIYKTKRIATIEALAASDLVDSPAATDKLFSSDNLAANVTEYLDQNPELYKILSDKPEIVEGFLTNYNNYLGKKKTEKTNSKKPIAMAEKNENKPKKDATVESVFAELQTANMRIEELETASMTHEITLKTLNTQIKTAQTTNEQLTAKIAEKDRVIAETTETSQAVIDMGVKIGIQENEIKSLKVNNGSLTEQLQGATALLETTTSALNKANAANGYKKGTDVGLRSDGAKSERELQMEKNAAQI